MREKEFRNEKNLNRKDSNDEWSLKNRKSSKKCGLLEQLERKFLQSKGLIMGMIPLLYEGE